jgi:hypothetical protein
VQKVGDSFINVLLLPLCNGSIELLDAAMAMDARREPPSLRAGAEVPQSRHDPIQIGVTRLSPAGRLHLFDGPELEYGHQRSPFTQR